MCNKIKGRRLILGNGRTLKSELKTERTFLIMATGNNKWVKGAKTETERNKNYKMNDEIEKKKK